MRSRRSLEWAPMRTRLGRTVGAAALTLGVMMTTACGDEPGGQSASGAPGAAGASGAPGGTTAPSAGGTQTDPTGDAGLEARAKSRFLPEDALGSSWRLSQPPQPGFGLTVCGVDIEPEEPRGSARRRFAQSPVGPFLSQYVQAHRDGLAEEVVARLKEALPTCTTFETRGESATSPVSRFTIDEASFAAVPDNAVVWRMTSQGARKVTQDIALVADGEFLIGLVSVAAGDPPDPAVVTRAVAALPEGD